MTSYDVIANGDDGNENNQTDIDADHNDANGKDSQGKGWEEPVIGAVRVF